MLHYGVRFRWQRQGKCTPQSVRSRRDMEGHNAASPTDDPPMRCSVSGGADLESVSQIRDGRGQTDVSALCQMQEAPALASKESAP